MTTATMASISLWQRHNRYLCGVPEIQLSLDVSRMRFDDDDFLERMAPAISKAFHAMDALEDGAIANPDEGRMVGHIGCGLANWRLLRKSTTRLIRRYPR